MQIARIKIRQIAEPLQSRTVDGHLRPRSASPEWTAEKQTLQTSARGQESTFNSRWFLALACAAGAALGLLVLLVIARYFALTASRMLLGGIALAAFSGSLLTVILARGGLESFAILAWLTGSTQQVTPELAIAAAATTAALLLPLPLFARWLKILPLGEATSASLGMAVMPAKTRLVICASLLTGAATLIVGPVSFVGLMAPHLARMLGLRGAGAQLAGAVLVGALLMAMADWLTRLVFYPYQMPVGLFASLIGAPYLVWALTRGASAR